MTRTRRSALVGLVAAILLALVSPADASSSATARTPESVLAQMTLSQRVGQLFMVGTPATSASASTLAAISKRNVGNVMLTGRSYGGVAVPARTSAALRARASTSATRGVKLFVATDQEGGRVQVLNGPGFSDMPSAYAQARSSAAHLRTQAGTWARQLRKAGVNVNLGPVLDIVASPAFRPHNAPIGANWRHYGYSAATVSSRGNAFRAGMADGGVAAAVKHFPGLGRVRGNTDTTSGVRDTLTGRRSPFLTPFRDAVAGGTPFVMMSSAYYTKMDAKNPAVFSSTIIRTVLRGDLGFRGIVVSDDVANARALAAWPRGQRAVRFIDAGGTMVLTVNPATLPAMRDAVLAKAKRSPAFKAKVDQAALTVLRTKKAHGLL